MQTIETLSYMELLRLRAQLEHPKTLDDSIRLKGVMAQMEENRIDRRKQNAHPASVKIIGDAQERIAYEMKGRE